MLTLGRRPIHERRARSDALPLSARGDCRGLQIGPRIRIGGTVGKIGEKIKGVLPGVGSMIGGSMIPGGNLVGSAIEGATNGKGALNQIGSDFKKGAINTAAILGGKALLGAGGGGSLLDKLKGILGSGGDLFGKLVGGGEDGGGSGLLDKALLAGTLASNVADKQRQEGFQTRAANYATDPFDAKSGIRSKALGMLNDDSTSDLSSIFSNPGNVYDRQKRGLPALTDRVPAAAMATQGNALENRLMSRIKAPTQAVA